MKKTLRISVLTLMLLFVFTFVACAPKDMDAAKKKLEKEDYKVIVTNYDRIIDGACGILIATKMINLKADTLYATLYESKADAKAAYEEGGFDKDEDQKVQRFGKWIVIGSEEAIKDFK